MSDQRPRVVTERDGHVQRIILDRADKMNAFDVQMLRELAEAVTAFEADPELRCAVLCANGDHFTAGLDLAEVGPAVRSGEALFPAGSVDPLSLHEPRRKKPLVMAAQGWCLTLGIELLLASDIRLAAEGTHPQSQDEAGDEQEQAQHRPVPSEESRCLMTSRNLPAFG